MTLTFDLLTLNFYSTSGVMCQTLYKIGAKLNNPRLSYSRFSTFASCNFREWALLPNGSQGCVDPANFTKLSEDIG